MKKKILVIALVVVLLAILMTSGSLAWFLAEDEVSNTFTIGSVKIEVEEDFESPEHMIPVVTVDESDPNYVNKDARVKNIGSNPCYVQLFVAIPKELDDAGAFIVVDTNTEKWTNREMVASAEVYGVMCNIYRYQYTEELAVGSTTEDAITAAYMAPQLDYDGTHFIMNGSKLTGYTPGESIEICVAAQAIQSEGFSGYAAALAEFGDTHPWA